MKKRILIIVPGNLYPLIMAFQDRIIQMASWLKQSHHLELVALYRTDAERKIQEQELPKICDRFYLLAKPNRSPLSRKFFGLLSLIIQKIGGVPQEMIFPRWPSLLWRIRKIIKHNSYDIVQIETWWHGSLFKWMTTKTLKVIDTHDVLYEKRGLELAAVRSGLTVKDRRYLEKYKKFELENTGRADCIISISQHDCQVFKEHFPSKQHLIIPVGQNMEAYLNYPRTDNGQTILFYGSMSGRQNILSFWRLYRFIFPRIKASIPGARLIVLGAHPPEDIRKLHDGSSVLVTGYVEDVRVHIAQSTVMILPLSTAGGFRSRIVEVMAMGVPVIGTHNALDGIGLTSGQDCFIEDDNDAMAGFVIQMMKNKSLLLHLSEKCRMFCTENFTLEKTYGKLCEYYQNL